MNDDDKRLEIKKMSVYFAGPCWSTVAFSGVSRLKKIHDFRIDTGSIQSF